MRPPARAPAKKTTEHALTDTTATTAATPATASHTSAQATAFSVILAVSFCHCVNDIM
ncbi:MAG: MFS transporter, partial [Mesorhizobium sp.]